MPRSFHDYISKKIHYSLQRVWWKSQDIILEPIKMEILQQYLKSKGFHLGITHTLLGARRGPLVVSAREFSPPTPREPRQWQWMVALCPGEQFDAQGESMPNDPFEDRHACSVPKRTPLGTPLLLALEQAVIAIEKLRQHSSRSNDRRVESDLLAN